MLFSMTGYGRTTSTFRNKQIIVEIKSLNSKFTDIRFKLPNEYREKEHELRKIIIDSAKRGKLEVIIEVNFENGEENSTLNVGLFKQYHALLTNLSEELDIDKGDMMTSILRLPNVVVPQKEHLDVEEWTFIKGKIQETLEAFNKFRLDEGKVMENDLIERIKRIIQLLKEVEPFEKERIQKLRLRIQQNLEEFLGKENVDKNRFEQEVIFYIEKIDVSEEKVRLAQHLEYFLEELVLDKLMKGKKLSFICQEIGREVNTLGSKAYSSDIQRFVVTMKDELEKIKEQVANAL